LILIKHAFTLLAYNAIFSDHIDKLILRTRKGAYIWLEFNFADKEPIRENSPPQKKKITTQAKL